MKKTYQVLGMKCAGCANTVAAKLSAVRGVENVDVDFKKELVTVTGKPFKFSLKRALRDTKYKLGDEK